MKFSIWMQPLHHPEENPTMKLEDDLTLIQHLDKLGFNAVFVGEHHSTGWEPIGSPEILLTAAAMKTKNIKLGAGIIPLAIHNPLHVLERAILIDHLSRGRSILGIGVGGGLPSDLHVYGIDRDTARVRFNDSYDVIKKLLENIEPVNVKTDWFELKDMILQLLPYGSFPVIMATRDPEKLKELGRIGGYVMFGGKPEDVNSVLDLMQEGANEVGKIASRDQIYLVRNLFIAETNEKASKIIKNDVLRERTEFYENVNGMDFKEKDLDSWFETYIKGSIVGSPEFAINEIKIIQERSGGIGGLVFSNKDWGSFEDTLHSLELFARYVMPKFNGSSDNLYKAAKIAKQINSK